MKPSSTSHARQHIGFDYWGTNYKRRGIKCDYYAGWAFGDTSFGHWVIKLNGYARSRYKGKGCDLECNAFEHRAIKYDHHAGSVFRDTSYWHWAFKRDGHTNSGYKDKGFAYEL